MKLNKLWPGLLFTVALALVAMQLQKLPMMKMLYLNSMVLAIILGMLVSNLVKLPTIFNEGVKFAAKKILNLAIILLGFELSFGQVLAVGGRGLILVTIVTSSTLIFAIWLGKRAGLTDALAVMIGVGTGVCGASAVAAVAPVVKAEEKDTAFAVAAVTLFGTLAMFIYPAIYRLWQPSEVIYSIWAGSSIHGVGQAVAAGFAAGDAAGQFATLVKLARVLLLIPITVYLGVRQMRLDRSSEQSKRKLPVQWFVFGFLGVVILNSLQILPTDIVKTLIKTDKFLLTWAMVGLGLETSFAKMKTVGLKPFYVGLIIWVFIAGVSLGLARLFF